MEQYEMLLAEIERRKKVLTVLGEGCIVGQSNAAEYKLLCELEEFAKGLTSEVTSEVTSEISEDLEESAKTYAKKESHGYEPCNIVETFKAGAKWQKQQMMANAVEGAFIRRNRYTKKNVLNGFDTTCDAIQGFKDKDKVKLIIFKED